MAGSAGLACLPAFQAVAESPLPPHVVNVPSPRIADLLKLYSLLRGASDRLTAVADDPAIRIGKLARRIVTRPDGT
jgi:hypothetical protein